MNIIELLITVYHSINSFMATDGGELFKKFFELFLFMTVSYMVASEYGRSREPNLKYLLIGFLALAINKLIMTFVFSLIVFGKVKLLLLNPFLPILDLFLEIFALVLLTNSFIFPLYVEKQKKLKLKIAKELMLVIAIVIIMELLWVLSIRNNPYAIFKNELSYLILELLKIIVLFGPIYYIIGGLKKMKTYGPHIILAFLVYMITPITNVFNIVFYNGLSSNLRVFAHPFPFIAVLLFTRVTYLKLVDKATIKKELAEAKQKYVQEHELSMMKDEFVSTVSHELKTPLTSMKLYLSLLNQNKFGKLSGKQINAVGIVEKEANRLTRLISDILGLSKLEAKKISLHKKKVDLCKLVNDNLYQTLAEQKGIRVDNKIPKEFYVHIDSEKFKQVFINLLSNAINYSKSKIIISVERKSDSWKFIIEDDGEGIPKDKLDKLFDKFFRVGNYLTKDKGGTGLGLAIVKNIVELHGGKVWAESEVGIGSKFIVEIRE